MKSRRNVTKVGFVIYITIILWITLVSRIGTQIKRVYPPFWSYRVILQNDDGALIETVENIVLFIPTGILFRIMSEQKAWKGILLGFGLSVGIELFQWLLSLGSTEVDDVINNTIGTCVGIQLATKDKRKLLINVTILLVIVFVTGVMVNYARSIHNKKMRMLASLWDRTDEKENLLVLNGTPGYISDFYVSFLDDGSLVLSGKSSICAWKVIGEVNLPQGHYSFSGLKGTKEKTIGIELEYYDQKRKKYLGLTPLIGPVEEVTFTLDKETQIRAYIWVYPGAEGNIEAQPVIYRED